MGQAQENEQIGPRVKDRAYWDRFFGHDDDQSEEVTPEQVLEIAWLSVTEDSGFHRVNDVRRFV